MNYNERLAKYEAEKRKLYDKNLTTAEYLNEIQKLTNKYKV